MRKEIFFITTAFVSTLLAVPSHAQLLKKLKEKVNDTVDKVNSSLGDSNSNNSTTGDNTQGSGSSTTSTASATDFSKYNITTQIMYRPSDIKEEERDLQSEYSTYEINGGRISGNVIFFAWNSQDSGEGGSYADNFPAYVFQNGHLAQKTTVADIENKKEALGKASAKYDWPYPNPNEMIQGAIELNPVNQTITFNEKKYGPYGLVTPSVIVNKEKTKFYAIIAELTEDGDPVFYLISYEGKKIKLPARAMTIITNFDFSTAAACVTSAQKESDLYFIDGRIVKNALNSAPNTSGFQKGWIDGSGKNYICNAMYNKIGEPITYAVYIDGKKILDESAEHVWCNADASKWCYHKNGGDNPGHLVFSDGTDISNAIHPVEIPLNGKNYIVWFQFKNGSDSDLLLCQKEL